MRKVKYHSFCLFQLIFFKRQLMKGSLTGAVASKKVTEAYKGELRFNRPKSVMAKARLTVRLTNRTGMKVGHSDPVI